ncbi:ATP-binding protein [uncultured Roseovarius sp.]|uniref:ATP-binding protein n=1 Tax=uncultured Roseovarius sp. TaxID=293344 RepID=UPI0025D7B8B9|nr:ATP-binding protein [uncultured Roseovarius sp.]
MAHRFSLSETATESGVRRLLSKGRARLVAAHVPASWLGTIELVWAEALNNIAEHAYAGLEPGKVHIDVAIEEFGVSARIRDRGRPLPGLEVPVAQLPESACPVESLPEGGFGWFLINDLCESVIYQRQNGENQLSLIIHPKEHTA